MSGFENGRDTDRVELWKVAPRAVPFALGITPSDICNFRCNYCNQSTEAGIADAKILSWENFIILAEQIERMIKEANEKIKIIRVIGNGEPLINKRLPDMVKYISDHNFADRIEITTNGSLLTHQMSDALIEAGLTRLLISVQGVTKEKYEEICGYQIDYDKYLEQIGYFYNHKKNCRVFVKTVDIALESIEERNLFMKMFSPIADDVGIENVIKACADVDYETITSKNIDGTTRYGTELIRKICCDTLFMYMNVHSNGDVDCCGCKYPPLYIGNIYDEELLSLWNGKKHREIMIKHLKGERFDIPLCSECSSIEHYNGFAEDNMDLHREDVLKRLIEMEEDKAGDFVG